jgi:hypothetical protein
MRAPSLKVTFLVACAVSGITAAAVMATRGQERRQSAGATLYVALSGSDAGQCTQSKPCASFDGAYGVARPGATVLVEPGSYPEQQIDFDSTKTGNRCDGYDQPMDTSGCITFRAATPGTVRFAEGITVIGNGVRLVGFDLGSTGIDINPGNVCHLPMTRGVILDHLSSNGGKVSIDAAQYVTDLYGNWSNGSGESLIAHSCNAGTDESPSWIEPTHIRLDHSWYHDVIDRTGNEHIECIHLDAADYVTIEASRFTNCAGYDIRIAYEHRDVENVSHYLIENTFFAASCSNQGPPFYPTGHCNPINELEFDGSCLPGTSCDSNVIRFNTIDGHFSTGVEDAGRGAFTNTRFYGNVLTRGNDDYHCKLFRQAGITFSSNVFGSRAQSGNRAQPCGPTDVIADGQLVAPEHPHYDFRLASRTVKAAGLVPANVRGGLPALDFAGQLRPTRAPIDAGAMQWETAAMILGRSIGALQLGESEAAVISMYGPPRRTRASIGKAKLDLLTYRAHRGTLSAYLDAGKVVGAGTTSPYYTSPTGIGVGADAAQVRRWSGAARDACRRAYHRGYGSVGVYVGVTGGKRGTKISSVTMIRDAYAYGDC